MKKNSIGKPRKFDSPEKLKEICYEYFNECDKTKKPYGICGLAVYLGVDRSTLNSWTRKFPDTYGPIVIWARSVIAAYLETGLYSKAVNGVKFNLANNFGWSEKNENVNINTSYEEYLEKMKECTDDEKY